MWIGEMIRQSKWLTEGEKLVLEAQPIDYGHDLTLLRQNLALTPEERIRRGVAWSNTVRGFPRVRR